MVKALQEDKDLLSKNLHTPKDGSVQKKKNQKFKQTPTGKVTLVNGSKGQNNSSMKQEYLDGQKGSPPQKSPGRNKEQKKNDSANVNKKQSKSPKNELQKKNASESEEDESESESESDEDINEGIVLEEQSLVQESDSDEDEESDEDESENENVPNILGTSLADDTEEDDEDYEHEEIEEKKDIQVKKGVQMFKGVKQNDKRTNSNESSNKSDRNSSVIDEDEDDDSAEEDEDVDDDDSVEEEDDEESDDDNEDEESEEDEEEGDESTLGLKALLGNSIADDDSDEDFVNPEEDDEDDDIDEDEDEEDEVEEKNNSTLDNSGQGDANDSIEELKMDKRTIFIGNLPTEVTKKQLKKEFKKFGHIETIRLRGIVSKTMNMPKKVAAITKKVHPKLKSVHAYIRYDSEESATAALSMNGKVFEGSYLRVDTVHKSDEKRDSKKCVFLGNLQFNIDDNTIRKHFEDCGEIESIRIVRDNKTGIGKGFGYINFKTEDAVALALELNGTKISNREVRVKPYGEQDKKKKDKHGKRSLSAEKSGGSPKKLKNNAEVAVPTHNKDNAMKRINDKKHTSPQQVSTYQGQKAEGKKKKGKNKFNKKKKLLAEKLTAKPKKPAN